MIAGDSVETVVLITELKFHSFSIQNIWKVSSDTVLGSLELRVIQNRYDLQRSVL